MTGCWSVLLSVVAIAEPAPEVTVDLAEEAELLFRRGIEAYRARRYNDALLYLLASNRIVPNRIVVFDLARTYEEIDALEAAWRYYSWYATLETDPAEKAEALAALERITPKVARLSVVTDPPGAAIYLDSRSLGRRGITPLEIALPEGKHHLVLERDGYSTVEIDIDLQLGQRTDLSIPLGATPEAPKTFATLNVHSSGVSLVDLGLSGCRVLGTEALLIAPPSDGPWSGSAWAAAQPAPAEGLYLDVVPPGAAPLRRAIPTTGKRTLVLGDPSPLHQLIFPNCAPSDRDGIASALAAMPKGSRRAASTLFAEWAAWRGQPPSLEAVAGCADRGDCALLAGSLVTR